MDKTIVMVSGLPRSGTSMMMKMLEAGGLEVVTDEIRKADEDNPRGYYEYEMVKKIKEDTSWLKETRGKVFKMVSMLLFELPPDELYKVIFMRRTMGEILESQRKMLERKGQKPDKADDERMGKHFNKHLDKITNWIEEQKNIDVLYVNYNDFVESPHEQTELVNQFLDNKLNTDEAVKVVDKTLYRNRK